MQRIQKAYILVSNNPNEIQKMSAYSSKTLSSIIKTCLGPRAMQKMVLTKINSIELTNDGNSILREMDVGHPAARCLIELSQTQDDVCGDGTTSVVILAAELLDKLVPLLDKYHPIKICKILTKVKNLSLEHLNSISKEVINNEILKIVKTSVATKLCSILKVEIPELALKAAEMILEKVGDKNFLDLKTNLKIDKILGKFEESEILDGILLEKDIVHSQMRKNIENPRILLLDSSLEYKKGESVTNLEFNKAEEFNKILQLEEEQIRSMCSKILEVRPDIVITEKGISDLALSILQENNITAIRRIKKSDAIRISKITKATSINRIEDIEQKHLGSAGLFEYIKIGDTYFCKFSKCSNTKAVNIVLRGPTKDILTELERNFMDAVKVAKNIIINNKIISGGGAAEMSISLKLLKEIKNENSIENEVFLACSEALKVIPSILISNSGVDNPLEVLNDLETTQLKKGHQFGINGVTGEIVNVSDLVIEPLVVKNQSIKSAFEAVTQLLRIDGIIETKTK